MNLGSDFKANFKANTFLILKTPLTLTMNYWPSSHQEGATGASAPAQTDWEIVSSLQLFPY